MNVRGNKGVIATGSAQVTGAAVASGSGAQVDFRAAEPPAGSRDGRAATPEEIRDLLARLIEELGRSEHPDRADLAEFAQDAREELESPEPRGGKLRRVARALADAVSGFASLAALAGAIEGAVSEL
ncbi:hypothetical protein [Streptomyces boncukensis]|uniref:Uncharacterized protein n=1 Tax=Streptomyces boncukensis TaxID=2711219 RepID=A0A6G4X0U6_9ACTN|nr:hypothetical protein [Streptomyces boncukensis]NGO71008.1 hypothetical protein [Streptomyces boncukensis]